MKQLIDDQIAGNKFSFDTLKLINRILALPQYMQYA